MKKFLFVFITTFFVLSFFVIEDKHEYALKTEEESVEKRAIFFSYLEMNKYVKNKSTIESKKNIKEILNNIKSNGFNTLILHVRPFSDAIYNSSIFPVSDTVKTYGKSPSYDVLKYFVDEAKKLEIEVHAWINPYRISNEEDITLIKEDNPAYEMIKSNDVKVVKNEGIFYNPASKRVNKLIISGIEELLTNYEIDGIHFDDYFYVSGMANELEENQKKEYVNQMVKKVYDTVKETDVSCEFGISPAGNLDNARSQGADIDTWLSVEGYIDYIMPQIYWTDMFVTEEGNKTMFTDRCKEWMEINILDLPIYIGLALYRVGENSSTDIGWSIKDVNLKEQYETALDIGCDGYVLFRYEWLEKELSNNELNNLLSYVNGMFVYSYLQNSYISYTVCGENKDWSDAKKDGITAKSEGAPLWGIVINLGEKVEDGYVIYRTQHSDYTYSPWCPDGTLCYDGKNITNVQIMLKGEVSKEYDVYYRCKLFDYGWTSWVSNGMLPLENNQLNVEGIQIKMIKKT